MSSEDSFQLYDLRVEIVCPPGAKILCGAKEGDHFTLEGEMLHLPPGQGISIYSLCEFLPHLDSNDLELNKRHSCSTSAFSSQATSNAQA